MQPIGKKSNSLYKQGYIYAPYIIVEKPIIIEGDISHSRYWIRNFEIRKRNIKIEKILNKINGNI